MCGRYYVDDETARVIEKLVRNLDRKLHMKRTEDVFPSQNAMVIKGECDHFAAEQMRWGFPGFTLGQDYKLVTTVVDADTGNVVTDANGTQLITSTNFTAEATSGYEVVTMDIATYNLVGKTC